MKWIGPITEQRRAKNLKVKLATWGALALHNNSEGCP